jgi:hypothetical protein
MSSFTVKRLDLGLFTDCGYHGNLRKLLNSSRPGRQLEFSFLHRLLLKYFPSFLPPGIQFESTVDTVQFRDEPTKNPGEG